MLFCIIQYQNHIYDKAYLVFSKSFDQKAKLLVRGVLVALIMVRFEKFKIWHAQGSDADQSDPRMTSLWQQSLSDVWLLWAYLINRWADFAHFWQANWYGLVGLT